MVVQDNLYYIYRHTTLDTNEVFYIGIGKVSKRRVNSKIRSSYFERAYNKTRRNSFWKRVENKHKYTVEILSQNLTEEFVKELEVILISYYGRRDLNLGSLVNLTNGGEGFVNLNKTEEHKKKIGIALKGRIVSEKTREVLRLANTGKKLSQEAKNHLSNLYKGTRLGIENPFFGKTHTEENKQKWSDAKSRGKNKNAKIVLCLQTGVFYDCVKDACETYNINYSTLRSMLQGVNKNKTSLVYC